MPAQLARELNKCMNRCRFIERSASQMTARNVDAPFACACEPGRPPPFDNHGAVANRDRVPSERVSHRAVLDRTKSEAFDLENATAQLIALVLIRLALADEVEQRGRRWLGFDL